MLGQSFSVAFPLILTGGLAVVTFGTLVPVVRRRYTEVERRKMAAMDV